MVEDADRRDLQIVDERADVDPAVLVGVLVRPVGKVLVLEGEPVLVAEIEYRRWPTGGLIQQGAYKGLRIDKRAKDVVRETPT